MARIVPELSLVTTADGRLATSRTGHAGEAETILRLKKELPNDYTVFHNVVWGRSDKRSSKIGEVDFVVVNRGGDVLLIEQKNGDLGERHGFLIKEYESGPKDVVKQLDRNRASIEAKLNQATGGKRPSVLTLLYFPDYRVIQLDEVRNSTHRVVDASRAAELASQIQDLIAPGAKSADGEAVLAFFERQLAVVPDIHAYARAGEQAMIRLSGGLADTVQSIEMQPLRLRVKGAAGCGKSAVAARAFTQAVQAGRRPLMLCFNRPLAEKLKAAVGPGGRVDTWYGFLSRFLEARGKTLDFAQMPGNPDFWREVIEAATVEPVPDDWLYDTVIVDEGQDFDAEWAEVLGLFAAPGADRLWLEDPDQALSRRVSPKLEGYVGYRAGGNFRSPESIGRFLREVSPISFEIASEAPGLGVAVHPVREAAAQSAMVAKIVTERLRQGFRHGDIAILSLSGLERATLTAAQRIGSYTVRRFTGDYDLYGNQVFSEGQLAFDTVRRFKGQQAPAVILTDVDPRPDRLEEAQRLLFCGATRATVRLDIVAAQGNPANAPLFDAAA